MKPKKLKKRIQQLEKCLREGSDKLARLKQKLQKAETAKALKAARKSAARATASAEEKPASGRKPKKKLNLSPERRAQLAAAMKARWAAKRASEGNSASATHQNSPTQPTQLPENRSGGIWEYFRALWRTRCGVRAFSVILMEHGKHRRMKAAFLHIAFENPGWRATHPRLGRASGVPTSRASGCRASHRTKSVATAWELR